MAKKKNKRRKQGMLSKVLNGALILLAFAKPIEILFAQQDVQTKARRIVKGATFGLSEGAFNLDLGLEMYTPALGAVALGTLKSFVMRKFPVRG